MAAAIVAAMDAEEVLGQLFMIAYPGTRPDEACMRWIRERGAAGVKIFGWNAQDERDMVESIAAMQAASLAGRFGLPLLVATDQEGGWIRHVGGRTSQTPGNMALGASGFPRDAYESGLIIGAELAALGINMNFAPVVDLATDPASWIIGSRAFSDDPMQTAILAAAYARGLADSGVIATAKHFPGHGDTSKDSHVAMPVIGVDWDTLWGRELLPYRVLAKDGLPAVMSGHLAFPAAGSGMAPASLSPFFLRDVLRKRIGFRGVVVTDDLRMEGAVAWAGSLAAAAESAIRAGNDIILMSSLPSEDCWQRCLETYRMDPAFRARCLESANRVLSLKLERLRGEGAVSFAPDYDSLSGRLPDPRAGKHALEVSARAVTFVKPGSLPWAGEGESVLIASQYAAFIDAGLKAYPRAAVYRFSYSASREARAREAEELSRLAAGRKRVIISISNDGSAILLSAPRRAGAETLAVAVYSPAVISGPEAADAIVACYSSSAQAFLAAFSAIRGSIPAQGRLPFAWP